MGIIKFGEWVSKKGFDTIYIQNSKTGKSSFSIYRVIVGEYKREEDADLKITELTKSGITSAVIYTFHED